MRNLIAALVLVGALSVPCEGRGQISGGVFGAWAQDAFDGSPGVGVQITLDTPILPLDVFGSGTWFFADCGGCDLKGWSLGVTLRPFPFPVARPYVVGGLTSRDLEDVDVSLVVSSSGAFAGAGLDVALLGLRVFAEGRYEFLDGVLEQPVMRAGVLF